MDDGWYNADGKRGRKTTFAAMAIDRRKRGDSTHAIATDLNTSWSTIVRWAKKYHGVDIRMPHRKGYTNAIAPGTDMRAAADFYVNVRSELMRYARVMHDHQPLSEEAAKAYDVLYADVVRRLGLCEKCLAEQGCV